MTRRCRSSQRDVNGRSCPLDAQRRVAADEAQRLVPQQRAGEESRLAEDLESVADPEHEAARRREVAHCRRRRGESRDRAAAEVVPVRESARHDDGVETGEVALLVPDRLGLRAERGERPERVPVVLRAGVRDDADPGRLPRERCSSLLDLHLVRLDERVREQLLAHPLDLGLCLRGVGRLDVEVDDFADARVLHREAEVAERRADRLALRVEDPRLRPHENSRPHPSTTDGSSTYAGERNRREALERLDILLARSVHDVGRDLRAGIRLVPAGRLAVVADELLVEAVLRAAGLVRVARPEPRGVGRERLVAEHEVAVGVEPISNFVSAMMIPRRERVLGGRRVEPERDLLDLSEQLFADELRGLLARDVLVVPFGRLCRRREDRSRGACPIRAAPPAARARRPRRRASSPSSRSPRDSRARRTRSAASPAGGTPSSGRRRGSRACGSGRSGARSVNQ